MASTLLAPKPATQKQIDFLRSLTKDREVGAEYVQWLAEQFGAGLTAHGASTEIESLLAKPKRKVEKFETVEPGFYIDSDDNVFEVVKSKNSGHTYAKALTVKTKGGQVTGARWTYAKGAMAKASTWTKMTHAEAAAFGQKFGICAICGRLLTKTESIERGIGPICAGKVG
jgi:hypothetical protein